MIPLLTEAKDLPFMAVEYVQPEYSRTQIEAAGKALAGRMTDIEEAVGIFRIAYNWRDAHVFPMRRVRQELGGAIRRNKANAIAVARLKRMKSIRRKLQETPLSLYQIQDIGGSRAIVATMQEMNQLIDFYSNGNSSHGIIRHWPYIKDPKVGGYRSHHIVLKYNGSGDDVIYNRQRIEVQIRTRLQHVWSTAVETAGVVRGENLKGGKGNPGWLRLFEIMSSEIADIERSPSVPGVPEAKLRREELKSLNSEISAVRSLNEWTHAIRWTERIPTSASHFYMLQYDPIAGSASVVPFARISQSSEALIQEEQNHGGRDTVLVELEKAEDLKLAYPNYFLDVRKFLDLLNGVLSGISLGELERIAEVLPPPSSRSRSNWNWRFGRWARDL
jgi:Region found in RelA / SpoT proteins